MVGKNELKQSLNTRDRNEAGRRAPGLIASFQRELDRARSQCTPVHPIISDVPIEDARQYVKVRLANMQALPDQSRGAGRQFITGGGSVRRERLAENRQLLEFLTEVEQSDQWDHWRAALGRSTIDAFEDEHIVAIAPRSQASGVLREFGAQAQIEHVRRAIHRDEQPFSTAPTPDLGGRFPDRDATLTLERLLRVYREDKEQTWRPSSGLAFRKVEGLLIDWFGKDRDVQSIERNDWRELFRSLPHMPASRAKVKAYRGMSLRQAIQTADQAVAPVVRLSAKSCADYVIHIQSLLNWASREELLPKNAAKSLGAPSTARIGTVRKPFTAELLQKLFSAPPYLGQSNQPPDDGKYWLPLIALFSGMRSGEIAQLRAAAIEQIDGILCIRLADPRLLKTEASVRDIPVHSELLRLGFGRLVERRRETAGALLFPDIRENGKEDRSSEFSKSFRKMLVGAGIEDPSLTMHSFRHTFAHALVAAQVPQATAEALQGWGGKKPRNMFAHYGGRPPVSQLAEAVELVVFPTLNLQHLYPCISTPTISQRRQFD
jgi:integrase